MNTTGYGIGNTDSGMGQAQQIWRGIHVSL